MSVGAKYFWLQGVTLSSHLPQKSFVTVGRVFWHHFCRDSVKLAFFSHMLFNLKIIDWQWSERYDICLLGFMKCFGLKALSLLISACYWVKDAIERAIGAIFLITHAVSQCYFLSDPWELAYRRGSRPHLKPAAIKMSYDRLSLFFLCRQASLNEAAEKYYGQAASLRPNVSAIATR